MEMSPTQDVQTPGLLEAMLKWHTDATILAAKDKAAFGKYVKYEVIKAQVTPLLHSLGLFAHHISHPVQGGVAVETVIYHTSGGRMSGGIVKVPPSKPSEAQYGAALTYAKRFSLVLALGIGGDKDAVEHKISIPLEDDITDDEQVPVEAKPKKAPAKKAPAKKPEENAAKQRSECWQEAGIAGSKTIEEARERYKDYAKGCRNRKLDPLPDVFESWLKNNFKEQKNV